MENTASLSDCPLQVSWHRMVSNQKIRHADGSRFLCVRLEPIRIPIRNDDSHSCFLTVVKLSTFKIFWNFSKPEFLMELLIDSVYLACFFSRQVNHTTANGSQS